MVPSFGLLTALFVALPIVSGNVEKVIFAAPHDTRDLLFNGPNGAESIKLESLHPMLLKLDHDPGCGDKPCRNVHTTLDTSFSGSGKTHWIVLDNLERGKRYEVRVCWAATSPTDFTLKAYTLSHLLSQPSILANMAAYATQTLPSHTVDKIWDATAASRSVLYLEMQAKAGYYSHNRTRMEIPDPVEVEATLDPFVFNIFPESLLPIGIMIVLAALSSFWASGHIYSALRSIASSDEGFQSAKKQL